MENWYKLPQFWLAGIASIIFFGSANLRFSINSMKLMRLRSANRGFQRFSSPIVDTV
jgi:hypothetical protein